MKKTLKTIKRTITHIIQKTIIITLALSLLLTLTTFIYHEYALKSKVQAINEIIPVEIIPISEPSPIEKINADAVKVAEYAIEKRQEELKAYEIMMLSAKRYKEAQKIRMEAEEATVIQGGGSFELYVDTTKTMGIYDTDLSDELIASMD